MCFGDFRERSVEDTCPRGGRLFTDLIVFAFNVVIGPLGELWSDLDDPGSIVLDEVRLSS